MYKVIVYGRKISTLEFKDIVDTIDEVHFLLEVLLSQGKIAGVWVSGSE